MRRPSKCPSCGEKWEGGIIGWLNTDFGARGRRGYLKVDKERWQCKECGDIIG